MRNLNYDYPFLSLVLDDLLFVLCLECHFLFLASTVDNTQPPE